MGIRRLEPIDGQRVNHAPAPRERGGLFSNDHAPRGHEGSLDTTTLVDHRRWLATPGITVITSAIPK